MNRVASQNLQRGGYMPNFDSFGGDRHDYEETPNPHANYDAQPQFQSPPKHPNSSSENIRLYITIRGHQDSTEEYKKLIIMTQSNIKISLLKRQIEREFTDLFPKEPTFICGKLEDQYGYALSNSSFIYELLKAGDRVTAYVDDIVNNMHNQGSNDKDGLPHLNVSNDVPEILYLLKNVQQSLCRKLADADIQGYGNMEEIISNVTPLGFSPSRVIVHNVAVVLQKLFSTERLQVFEGRDKSKILNLIVTSLNFWIGELIQSDNFLLSHVVNMLEILVKSATFCENFKGAFVISNLMNASNADFVSSQTKSRLIKIITYLSKGSYKNYYNPSRAPVYVPPVDQDRNLQERVQERTSYNPSKTNQNNHNSSRSRIRTPIRDEIAAQGQSQGQGQGQPIKVYDAAYSDDYQPRIKKESKPSTSNLFRQSALDSLDPLIKINTSELPRPENKLYKDYIALLTLGNTREMHVFAVQNMDLLIDKVIHNIMDSKEDYLQLLNLIEIELPQKWHEVQNKILESINDNLSERRAADGLTKSVVPRLLKALSYQPSGLHPTLVSLLQTHLVKGRYRVDVSTVISIILSPYSRLHDFAIKALSIMSDPSISDNLNYEIQFENHMKLLIELTLSKNKSFDFKNIALKTLSNLALKDNLRPQILYNKGLETMIYHLRNDTNLEGQRLAAKSLLNLSTSSRDIKLKIITEIADEVRKLHRNELDAIIQGYLQTLINSSR